MISTTIPLTLSLSIALGAYLIASGLGLVRLGAGHSDLVGSFEQSTALTLLAGAVAFAIGTTIILTHHVWTDPLAVVISLAGWLAAAKGLLLIAWPQPLWSLGRSMLSGSAARTCALAILVLGVLLVLAGLTGTAGRIH